MEMMGPRGTSPIPVVYMVFFLTMNFCGSTAQSSRTVPLNKWKQLSGVSRNQQFIYGFVDNKPVPGVHLTESERQLYLNGTAPGFSPTGVDIIAGQVAEPEGCYPQERSVPIPPNSDPRVIHWPPCTKLAQCGGCCGTDILECAPLLTETVTVQVMKVVYSDSGSGNFDFVGLEDVSLSKHLSCDCRCRIEAHHCNPLKQDYNEQSCSCRCRNENQATTCPSQKRWDDKECACVCPRILNCLDDEFFSYGFCSCQRGTPGVVTTSPSANLIGGVDPCSTTNCRSGFRAVWTGTGCTCRIHRSAIKARSAGSRYWP